MATPLAVAAMPGVGMLLFSGYLYLTTGDAFRWAAVHGAWGREYRGVWVVFWERYEYIAYYGFYQYVMDLPVDALNGLAAFATILAIVPVTRRFGLPYAIFMAASVLPPLAAGGTLSMGRVTAVVFPLFIWLAGALREERVGAWLVGFGVLQGLAAALFFTWRPLY
jgi:hypothetical protein